MERRNYTVILEPEAEGGYHAFVPALRGCHTQGDTLEEALANIHEAIEGYLESLQKHHEPFPADDVIVRSMDVAV